jgi:hypothetical protein
MRKRVKVILAGVVGVSTLALLSACGTPNPTGAPEVGKVRDSIKLLMSQYQSQHPSLVNWDTAAVNNEISGDLPKGIFTEGGYALKWDDYVNGELSRILIPYSILGMYPNKYQPYLSAYTAGKTVPSPLAQVIRDLRSGNDPYFAATVDIKSSKIDSNWIAFTSIPYLPVTDPGYGWIFAQNHVVKVVDFGTAQVGCGKVPDKIQKEFGFTCAK